MFEDGRSARLRAETRGIEGVSVNRYRRVDARLRELSNPNLHDIANMQTRVKLWTPDGSTFGGRRGDCERDYRSCRVRRGRKELAARTLHPAEWDIGNPEPRSYS